MNNAPTELARTKRVRRAASRENLHLIKYREGSRWFRQYGPYALADDCTNGLSAWGMDLEDLEAAFKSEPVSA